MGKERSFQETEGDWCYYPLALCASVLCALLFSGLSPRLSSRVWNNYRHLPQGVRVEWDARMVSTIHAVCVGLLSSYSQFFDDDMHTHLIWWDSPLVRGACAIVVGYLMFDTVLITVYFQYMGELGYYLHHAASIYAYYFVMSYDVMPFFANFRLLAEISTPFLNIRWFMLTMGVDKSSLPFLLNGLALCASFFLCRVLAIPLYWHKVYLASGMDGFGNLGPIPINLVVTCVVLDALNLFWFHKLLRGLFKMLASGAGSVGSRDRREAGHVKAG